MTPNENSQPSADRSLRANIHQKAIDGHIKQITHEMREGFELLQKYPKSVTIYGSSLAKPGDAWYDHARELGAAIVKETGYSIITGGGPGIMEAASHGAQESGGNAVGLHIELPRELTENPYNTDGINFAYFFTRKTMLAFAAEAYVFFPGGFGTFDELFGILTLVQTAKIPRVPIVLFDSKFWKPLEEFIRKINLEKYHSIDASDMSLFEITDSIPRVIEIIKTAPVSEWWQNIN